MIQNFTQTMYEVARRQGWTEKDIARLALAFLARSGQLERFEAYLVRVARNERERER